MAPSVGFSSRSTSTRPRWVEFAECCGDVAPFLFAIELRRSDGLAMITSIRSGGVTGSNAYGSGTSR